MTKSYYTNYCTHICWPSLTYGNHIFENDEKAFFFFLLNSSFDGYKSDLISVGLLNDLTRVKKKRQFFVCVQSSSSFTIHGLLRVI